MPGPGLDAGNAKVRHGRGLVSREERHQSLEYRGNLDPQEGGKQLSPGEPGTAPARSDM